MGADYKLPQATDTLTTQSTDGNNTELDLESKTQKSEFSLPPGEDVVIATRRSKHRDSGHNRLNSDNKSQTSLLIEYFEGGKESQSGTRRPSVRVKVTPSSKSRSKSSNDHVQITAPKGSRKASYTQRISLSDKHAKATEIEGDDNSVNSYRSATEESNVTSRSGGPIEVEIMPKRHGSPLIPSTESHTRYVNVNPSDISSMPADSFLDGNTRSPERKGSRSLSRGEALAAGAATGAAAAIVADKLKTPSRRRSRSLSRERIVAQKAVEKVRSEKSTSERRRKHRSRSRSISGEHSLESMSSPRRRSSRGHHGESLVSGVDTSLLNTNSQVSGRSGESFRSGTSKSSINNPKLLETVEDAIRRLILPELTALKREQSKHEERRERRDREKDRRGSITSGSGVSRDSRDEYSSIRRQSDRGSGTDSSGHPRIVLNDSEVHSGHHKKGRQDKHIDRVKLEDSPRTFERETSEETVVQDGKLRKKHSKDRHHGLESAAIGAGVGAVAAGMLHKHQSQDSIESERKERRRRRAKSRSRSGSLAESYEEREHEAVPPMPLMSEINASEITRSSILSADTERPQSASQEIITPIREVQRGVASPMSRTPTRTPVSLQQGLGMQHSNYSRGNLSLQHSPVEEQHMREEYEIDEHGHKVPIHDSQHYDQDDSFVDEEHHHGHSGAVGAGLAGAAAGAGLAAMHHQHEDHEDHDDPELLEEHEVMHNDYYHQEVPPPLRYVPYAQERRGLSPIQSVSGYTEGDPDQHRDSKVTRSSGSYSSLNRSIHHRQSGLTMKSVDSMGNVRTNPHDFKEVRHGELADSEITQDDEYWEGQHQENDRQREMDNESYRSSDYKRMTNYTDGYTDSMDGHHLDRVVSGQNVRGVGANPDIVHTPVGVESAVASLVNASELTGMSGYTDNHGLEDRRESYASYEDGSERHFTSPTKHDATRDLEYDGSDRGSYSRRNSPSKHTEEYELDEHGRKVAMPKYKGTHATEAALAAGAAGAAAVLIANRNRKSPAEQAQYGNRQEESGAPLHRSFKDRAQEVQGQIPSPRQSINGFSDAGSHDQFAMGASGLPDPSHPMPEIGFGGVDSDVETNPSVIQGPIGGAQEGSQEHWPGKQTPPQAPINSRQHSDANLKAAEAALVGAAAGLGGAEALASHSREHSHDHDEEWQRTSGERKRDTLITNPYEGTSPIAAIGTLDRDLLGQGLGNDFVPAKLNFQNGRQLASPKDEGYISSAPNNARSPGAMTPEHRVKGVGFMDQDLADVAGGLDGGDPFYTPGHARHLSGMSHGMGSPIYDSATGNGIDRIQSMDIVALMDHLTVRDAQRSARDTEILVTLVRAAAEMRNSFEDMKRLLADTEDVIITEVQSNTEKTVQKAINGPRPQPQSATRSLRQGSQDESYDDIRNKKRNVFRRALKGLSSKSTSDIGKIEDMLVQLLGEVEGLKIAQGLKPGSHPGESCDDLGQEGNYEHDRGYEPEGNAGTSTASHASQSGHLSIPRGASASRPYETRKFSDHRISTVPEGDEEEAEHHHEPTVMESQFDMDDRLLTPTQEITRGGSAPLGTPPQQYIAPASLSNENTPKTEKKKKHTSSSSSGWLPKVLGSRWSETTASTVFRGFRNSGRSSGRKADDQYVESHSRSNSDLGNYPQEHETYEDDKLDNTFSQEHVQQYNENEAPLPPEDPKYKAHRNSLNLQHPQPRPGPTHRYQTALESQAVNFDSPMSPKFSDWGSQTSLNRLPPQQTNRYSNSTSGPGNMSPVSDGGYVSPSNIPPQRPPKEPLAPERPPKIRSGKLTKPSPLSNEHVAMDDYEPGGSPRSAARKLSGVLSVPTRKPTGPRSMSSTKSGELNRDETVIRRKRDTFGTVASSNHSGESETF